VTGLSRAVPLHSDVQRRDISRQDSTTARPASAGWRGRRVISVEGVVALAMLGCIAYVPFATTQIRELQKQLASQANQIADARTFEVTARRNLALSKLEGAVLPTAVLDQVRALTAHQREMSQGFLLMIYTPMVCQRALHDGLRSLAVRQSAAGRSLHGTMALVGVRDNGDRENALLLREEGELSAPIAFVGMDVLSTALFPPSDSTFDDEPVYLRVDASFRVESAFHADQYRPALLDTWLRGVAR